jgi:hypothetical protein
VGGREANHEQRLALIVYQRPLQGVKEGETGGSGSARARAKKLRRREIAERQPLLDGSSRKPNGRCRL